MKNSWNNHVDHVCNTISKNIRILYKLQFLPSNILKMYQQYKQYLFDEMNQQ